MQPVVAKEMTQGIVAAQAPPQDPWDRRVRVMATPYGGDVERAVLAGVALDLVDDETRSLVSFPLNVTAVVLDPAGGLPAPRRVTILPADIGDVDCVRRACWDMIMDAKRGFVVNQEL